MASFQQACMIEKWVDKKMNDKVVVRQNSVEDFNRKSQNDCNFLSSVAEIFELELAGVELQRWVLVVGVVICFYVEIKVFLLRYACGWGILGHKWSA